MATTYPEPNYYQSYINTTWDKLDKYWSIIANTPIYYIITILHPGYRLSYIKGTFLEYNTIKLTPDEDYKHHQQTEQWTQQTEDLVRDL